MFIHGGRSAQSLTKTESTFTTVEPQWRRWSHEAFFHMIPLISWNCSHWHRTALQPKLSDRWAKYRVGGMSRRLRNFGILDISSWHNIEFWPGIRFAGQNGQICAPGALNQEKLHQKEDHPIRVLIALACFYFLKGSWKEKVRKNKEKPLQNTGTLEINGLTTGVERKTLGKALKN